MREIIFRGIREDTLEWVYGYVDATMYKDLVVIHSEASTHSVVPETVGQYTGLKDKNGKEIYEGDIVRWTRYNVRSEYVHNETLVNDCTVYWNDEKHAFWMRYDFKTGGGASGLLTFADERAEYIEFEVIGNIHEKPYQNEQ